MQAHRSQIVVALFVVACAIFPAAAVSHSAPSPGRFLITTSDGSGGPSAVEIVDQRGRVRRVVAQAGADPHWMPDGRLSAAWAPGGKLLAWVDQDGITAERADGSGKRRLASVSTDCSEGCIRANFAWSPDGQRIAIGGTGTKSNKLLVVSPATGRSVEIAPDDPFTTYTALGWTSDARSVVYRRSSGDLGSGDCCRTDIRVTSEDGKRTRVAYTFKQGLFLATDALSPDGRRLAFTSGAGGNANLSIVDLARGRMTSIKLPRRVGPAMPAWSPDSRTIALATLDGNVIAVDVAGGATRSLGRFGRSFLWLYWTRTDDLVVIRGAHRNELWVSTAGARFTKRFAVDAPGVDTLDEA